MQYHIIAFFCGFILDLILGDPHFMPHPIRLIGSLISIIDKRLNSNLSDRNDKKEFRRGILTVVIVLLCTVAVSAFILISAYCINKFLGILVEAIMTYQIMATKSLKDESMKVYYCLKDKTLNDARKAVSMIVGRDTENLDEEGVTKAAVETVAENTSDGVIAPMIYTAIGGPVLGFTYKAANTMDSMLGYKNEKYLYYGRAAAKLDDFVNYLPSRISAYLMILGAFIGGKDFSGKNAYRIYKRDNRNHSSPNSAQTEAVCAGALGIRLAGPSSYFGKVVDKPYIGDSLRSVECEDIKRVNRLMYITALIGQVICLIFLIVVYVLERF